MRYADGPTVRCETSIDGDRAHLWSLITDIELPCRFSPELRRVEWLDGATAPAVGARFAGYNRNPTIGEWRTVSHVLQLDTERTFAWAVLDADGRFGPTCDDPAAPAATWRFDLEPRHGGCLLRQSARIGPAPSGLSLAIDRHPENEERLVDDRLARLHKGMEATLRGIKDLAEGSLTG